MKKTIKILISLIFTANLALNIYAINNDNPVINSNTIILEGYNSGAQPIVLNTPISLGVFNEEYIHLDNLNHEIDKAKVTLMLDLGTIYKLGQNAFSVSLNFNIIKNTPNGNIFKEIDLELNEENPRQMVEIPYTYLVSGTNVISDLYININSLNITSASPDIASLINEQIRLSINSSITYKVDVKDQNLAYIKPITKNVLNVSSNTSLNNEVNKRVIKFEWTNPDPLNLDFSFYEFELLKVEPHTFNLGSERNFYVDWGNALKLRTSSSQKELTLTISQGSGFYLWRVRPIGNYYSGNLSYQNKGEWSDYQTDNSYIDINISTNPHSNIFKYIDPDEDKNWIYSRVIAENNKIGEQMVYGNGFGQAVQTQARMNESGFTLVSQGIKDYNGRTTLSTLPIPINQSLDNYIDNFVLNENNQLYTAKDFDEDANVDNPEMLHFANDYYNGNNDIPDDGGYPYSRVLFYKNGELKEQSGVGANHHLGTDKTTLTWFGQPSEHELIRIFGNEAPNPKTVLKTFIKDPNGTISISYTSMQGKVLATALSISDNSLEDVGSENIAEFEVVYNINDNVEIPNGFSSSKILVFPEETVVNVDYSIESNEGNTSLNSCLELGECSFTVTIEILDISSGDLYSKSLTNSQLDIVQFANPDNNIINNNGTDIILAAGTYQIKKIVQLNNPENILADIGTAVTNVEEGIQPVIALVSDWISQINNEQSLNEFYLKVNNSYITDTTNNIDQEVIDIINNGVVVELETPCNSSPCPYTNTIKILNAPCCDDFEIPFEYKPPIKCFSRLELISFYNANQSQISLRDSLGFEIYLENKLKSTYPDDLTNIQIEEKLDEDWAKLLPGYNRYSSGNQMTDPSNPSSTIPNVLGDFDRMIYHMLTDEYSCESNASNTLETQYKCKEVWNCWLSAINIIEPVLVEMAGLNDQSGPGFIQDQADEDKDADADEEFDNSDDSVDETAEEANSPGPFMQWITNIALSKKLREDVEFPKFTTNLAVEFLKCTGYKFAGIVERTSFPSNSSTLLTSSNGILSSDVSEYNDFDLIEPIVERVEVANYDANGNPNGSNSGLIEVYPYSLCPVFAFKYFEYDPTNSIYPVLSPQNSMEPSTLPDFPPNYDFKSFKTIKQLELSHCYDDLALPTDVNFCYPPPCSETAYYHENWSCEERYYFYLAIKSFQQIDPTSFTSSIPTSTQTCDEYFNGISPNNFTPPSPPKYTGTATTFQDYKFDIFYNSCNSGCEDRRKAITNNIVAMFIENCYVIEPLDCPVDDNVILMSDIEAIVENIIQKCKDECNLTRTDAGKIVNGEPDYPKITEEYCFSFNPNEYITNPNGTQNYNGNTIPSWLLYHKNCKLELGAKCHLDKVYQLKHWNIEIDIDKHFCGDNEILTTSKSKDGLDIDGNDVSGDEENINNNAIWWENPVINCNTNPTSSGYSNSNGYTQPYIITTP